MATLADELLLLAMDAGDGADATTVDVSLAAAQLAELHLLGRIEFPNRRVVVRDPSPTGRADLDEILEQVAGRREDTVDSWVYRLSSGVREPVTDQLVAAGAVVEEQRRVLGMFPTTEQGPADGAARAVAERVAAVAGSPGPVDDREAALVSLVESAGLTAHVLPGVDTAAVQGRVAELGGAAWPGAAAQRVMSERQIGAAVTSATTNVTLFGNNNY